LGVAAPLVSLRLGKARFWNDHGVSAEASATEVGPATVVQAGERRSSRIEALRALAALGVLVSHSLILSAYGTTLPKRLVLCGSLGVFLFFTLTGYLLYLPLARRAFEDGRRISLSTYARNRALRILPLYYVVLAVLLVVNEGGGTGTQWLRFCTFTQSFFSDTVSTVDGPMWSLVVEVQFYALLPLLAWAIAALARGSRFAAAAVIVLLGAASAVMWWHHVYQPHAADPRWQFSFLATFFNFTPGMLLALARVELESRPRRWLPSSTVLILAGAACWIAAAHRIGLGQALLVPASFLILAAVVLPVRDGLLARLLDLRALGIVGVASYSLYLWHYPIVHHLSRVLDAGFPALLPVALAICVPLALLSYRLIERPFLPLRRRWGSTATSRA
jgi:peptidoglycan/LPS O-acetylase OafA/YrhL